MPTHRSTRREFLASACAAALASGVTRSSAQDGPGTRGPSCSLVLRGGTVIDGTGGPARVADVGIIRDQIVAVGDGITGREEIDCSGKLVCPGFVDIHTHLDLACWPAVEDIPMPPLEGDYPAGYWRMMLEQGVTTVLVGNCGYSAPDVAAHLDELEELGPGVNYGTLVGHATLRSAAPDRPAHALASALAAGAYGLSVNLAKPPGAEAPTDELVALARAVAATEGALLAVHRRDESADIVRSTSEAVTLGRMSGARVQISHMRARSEAVWPDAERALDLVEQARAAGLDMAADTYCHTGGGMTLAMAYLPPEYARAGDRAALAESRDDPDLRAYVAARLGVVDPTTFYPRTRAYEGLYDMALTDMALARGALNLVDFVIELAASDQSIVTGTDLAPMGLAAAEMSPQALTATLARPFVALASDAGGPPSGDGSSLFPWCFGNTIRALSVFAGQGKPVSYEEAVWRLAGLPAARLGLSGRGVIVQGAVADLVVLDARRLRDNSLPTVPHARPGGVDRVFIGGQCVVEAGAWNGERYGQVLRRG